MRFLKDAKRFQIGRSEDIPPIATRSQMMRLFAMTMTAMAMIFAIFWGLDKKGQHKHMPKRPAPEAGWPPKPPAGQDHDMQGRGDGEGRVKVVKHAPVDPDKVDARDGVRGDRDPAAHPAEAPQGAATPAIRDLTFLDEMEWDPYFSAFLAVRDMPDRAKAQEKFVKFPYRYIHRMTEEFRHKIFLIRGSLVYVDQRQIPPDNPLGVRWVYEAQVNSDRQLFRVQFLHTDFDLQAGDVVDFYGSFHKLIRWEAESGDLRATPLLLAKDVVEIPASPEPMMDHVTLAFVICVLLLGVLFVYLMMRDSREEQEYASRYLQVRQRIRRQKRSPSQDDPQGEAS